MSVLKTKRSESKLDVISKAQSLAAYTMHICKNENTFPKRDRWMLTKRIVDEALDLVCLVRKANAVYVTTKEDYLYRRSLQVQAISTSYSLLTLMQLAYEAHGITSQRIEHWTGLVISEQELLRKWRASDDVRYKEYKG